MTSLIQDLRFGVRMLVGRPSFTALAVLTLALGTGATTAIFSVVDGVLLRPLPFADPGRLVVVWEASPERGLPFMNLSPPNAADFEARSRSLEDLAFWTERSYTVAIGTGAEQLYGATVSHDLFPLLGIAPVAGRTFTPAEDRPNGAKVVMLSHGLWRRAFGADRGIVGRTLAIDGEPHEIVGVMPDGFDFPLPVALEGIPPPRRNDLWTPLATDLASGQRGAHYLLALGRLRQDVTAGDAERELADVARQLAAEYPATNAGWTARVVPLGRQVTGDQRPALLAISVAVGLMLLLACANVAGLLLARGASRAREVAIRLAVGASRARVARQLMTETLLLAAAGGAAGLIVASWLTRTIRTFAGPMLPRMGEIALDGRALAFAAAACLVAALVSGVAPALSLTGGRLIGHLGHRGGAGRTSRLQAGLVVAELALSLVLLTGSALMARSFLALVSTDPGFRTERTVTAHLRLPATRYQDHAARAAFVERATELLEASPAIARAGTIDALPLADDRQGTGFSIDGSTDTPAVANANVNFAFVSPGYFDAMGIPLLRGRTFDGRDRPDGAPTIVVNEAFARRFLPAADPIGRRIRMGFNTQTPREIVGVVGDERHEALDEQPPPGVFVSYLQYGWSSRLTLVAAARAGTDAAVAEMRQVVRQLDPEVPLYDVRTLEAIVREAVRRPQFSTVLLGMFAAAALLLAATGVYGVISQLVSERTREFGVRYALGATRGDVAWLVLRFGGSLALLGTLFGLPAAFAFGRLLSGLLYGVGPGSPLPYVAMAAVLSLVALAAALAPARRATRVDPLAALRAE